MKTSELIGPALDWTVAKCEGFIRPEGGVYCRHHGNIHKFNPSTDWAQGGPIIEREKITLSDCDGGWGSGYNGTLNSFGTTPLIAAMRCYVVSKLGDDIEIPEELK